ncbi:MAG: riboflavin synthase subunit alpha [Marinobacter sp.]|uniref:riboflavin synthase subunit alpha n=1 Tax=Marinobacter sp. TaxID=50741 RepID=UPI0034A08947
MFTGIVQGIAHVESLEARPGLTTFHVRFPPEHLDNITIGASVALNGTCLTVTGQTNDCLSFDAMQETLRLTTLGDLQTGSAINFERAARIGDEIGGHLLSGHIHTTATVEAIELPENNCVLYLRVPLPWMRYIFPKGYIAINGASLTIGEVTDDTFNIYLIPETLRATTFSDVQVGDRINIEIDSQTQTIVDTLARMGYDQRKA